jgi:hypothetical protein
MPSRTTGDSVMVVTHPADRRVRPFHLALTISTSVIAWVNLDVLRVSHGRGHHGIEHLGIEGHGVEWASRADPLLGLAALAAVILLVAGWMTPRPKLAEWGLCVAAGVWTARFFFALGGLTVLGQGWPTAILSLAWAVGAGGSYLLERTRRGWNE